MSASSIDDFFNAEIPDKDLNHKLYKVVSEYMVHGPQLCMNDGKKCFKKFPKTFNERTIMFIRGVISVPLSRRMAILLIAGEI